MTPTLPPALAAPLAELALRELAQAGFGQADPTGRTEATIIAEALGAPAAVFALDADAPGTLRVATHAGWDAAPETVPTEGALADALARAACVELRPVPPGLPGVGGGLAVRVGGAHRPFALLAVLPAEARAFAPAEWAFLRAAAAALHARFALSDTRHALEESRARALSIVETTVDGVITIDAGGRIESFNAGAERIFGYAAEEVLGMTVEMLMPEPYHSEHAGYLEAYHTTGKARIIGIGREVVGRRKSGTTFPMDLAVSEVPLAGGGRVFTGLVRDISERRVLEREVLRVADAERRRIGQDLHDGLGQHLTAIGLFLRSLARTLDGEESAGAAEAHRLVGLVDEADRQARGLARLLVPVELERNGLAAALAHVAAQAGALYGVDVTAETDGDGPAEANALQPDAAANLFWIAQEAVANAAQHGRATHVAIHLSQGAEHLRLRIEDDGRGFDGAQDAAAASADASVSAPVRGAPDTRGMGLRIMHYRAHLAGGTLEIRSPGAAPGAPDRGTVVACSVPFRGPGFQTP